MFFVSGCVGGFANSSLLLPTFYEDVVYFLAYGSEPPEWFVDKDLDKKLAAHLDKASMCVYVRLSQNLKGMSLEDYKWLDFGAMKSLMEAIGYLNELDKKTFEKK